MFWKGRFANRAGGYVLPDSLSTLLVALICGPIISMALLKPFSTFRTELPSVLPASLNRRWRPLKYVAPFITQPLISPPMTSISGREQAPWDKEQVLRALDLNEQ